jgi:hypothetical protein
LDVKASFEAGFSRNSTLKPGFHVMGSRVETRPFQAMVQVNSTCTAPPYGAPTLVNAVVPSPGPARARAAAAATTRASPRASPRPWPCTWAPCAWPPSHCSSPSGPAGERLGRKQRKPAAQHRVRAALQGVALQLELRTQHAPEVDDDAPRDVDARRVQTPVLVVLLLRRPRPSLVPRDLPQQPAV